MSTLSASDNGSEVNSFQSRTTRIKGVRNIHSYKREIQKRRRLQGKAYVSTSTGNTVPARSNANVSCLCKLKCTDKFSALERKYIFDNLYDGRSKNEQDAFLMEFISRRDVQRRRSRTGEKRRENVFDFFILNTSGERVKVCRKAFSLLYAIKSRALYRLSALTASGKPAIDRRGRHMNRSNIIPSNVLKVVDSHIKDFISQNPYFFLNGDLDVKALHNQFCKKHPEYAILVKYNFYLKYYKDNYKSGVCELLTDASTCEKAEIYEEDDMKNIK